MNILLLILLLPLKVLALIGDLLQVPYKAITNGINKIASPF